MSMKHIWIAGLLILLMVGNVSSIGYVTVGMDDVYKNQSTYALPIFQANSIAGTLFVITNSVGSPASLNLTELNAFQSAGWEIAAHTQSHPDLRSLDDSSMTDEIKGSKDYLIANGFSPQTFAYPYGYYDNVVSTKTKQYFSISRTSDIGDTTIALVNVSLFNFNSRPFSTNSDATIKGWIDTAITNGLWVNLYFHNLNASGFDNTSASEYGQNITDIAQYIKSKVDAGTLRTCTFYECYIQLKNISSSLTINNSVSNQTNVYFDLRQDVLESPKLNVTGLVLNNTVINSDFEGVTGTTTNNWTKTGTGITYINSTTSDVYQGSRSTQVEVNISGTSKYIYQNVAISTLGLAVGDNYTYLARFKGISNITGMKSQIHYYNGGAYISLVSSNLVFNTPTGWYTTKIQGTIPATTTNFWITLNADAFTGGAVNGTFLVDAVTITKGDTIPQQYFSGTFTNQVVNISSGTNNYNFTLNNSEVQSLWLLGSNGTLNFTSNGQGTVNYSISGNRVFNVKYGWVELEGTTYNVTESFSNKTVIEFWKNATINIINNINYSIRSGVAGIIGTMTVIPSSNETNLTFFSWNTTGDYYKKFNESSSNATNTAHHIIGDFPALTSIQIKRDGVDYATVTSNATGYIDWTYSGGYSEHMFEMEIYYYSPVFTSWGNNKTNDESISVTINVSEPINFNATANQTGTWSWFVNDTDQINNFDNFTTSWASAGSKNVSVYLSNENGTSQTIEWTVNIVQLYIPPTPTPPSVPAYSICTTSISAILGIISMLCVIIILVYFISLLSLASYSNIIAILIYCMVLTLVGLSIVLPIITDISVSICGR